MLCCYDHEGEHVFISPDHNFLLLSHRINYSCYICQASQERNLAWPKSWTPLLRSCNCTNKVVNWLGIVSTFSLLLLYGQLFRDVVIFLKNMYCSILYSWFPLFLVAAVCFLPFLYVPHFFQVKGLRHTVEIVAELTRLMTFFTFWVPTCSKSVPS